MGTGVATRDSGGILHQQRRVPAVRRMRTALAGARFLPPAARRPRSRGRGLAVPRNGAFLDRVRQGRGPLGSAPATRRRAGAPAGSRGPRARCPGLAAFFPAAIRRLAPGPGGRAGVGAALGLAARAAAGSPSSAGSAGRAQRRRAPPEPAGHLRRSTLVALRLTPPGLDRRRRAHDRRHPARERARPARGRGRARGRPGSGPGDRADGGAGGRVAPRPSGWKAPMRRPPQRAGALP